MAGYLAYIIPMDFFGPGSPPDRPQPQPPVGIWPQPPLYPSQGPGFPTHPIAPGGQPPYPSQGGPFPGQLPMPGGGGNYPSQGLPPYPSQGLPPGGPPLFPSQGPGFPTHPIYIPVQPPGGEAEPKPPGMENLPPIMVWIPGIGWIAATPGQPRPDNTLPEQPQPEAPV